MVMLLPTIALEKTVRNTSISRLQTRGQESYKPAGIPTLTVTEVQKTKVNYGYF